MMNEAGGSRFVVLVHDWPEPHLDLMLQHGDQLLTWRLPAGWQPGQPAGAQPLAPHRLDYLDFEGEVSGGRGRVHRWDSGSLSWLDCTEEALQMQFEGGKLHGRYVVLRGAGRDLVQPA